MTSIPLSSGYIETTPIRVPSLKPWLALTIMGSIVLLASVDWSASETILVIGALSTLSTGVIGIVVGGVIKVLAAVESAKVATQTNLAAINKLEHVTNGNLTNAISRVATEVKAATLVDPKEHTAFPSTEQELSDFTKRVIAEYEASKRNPPPPSVQT